MATGPFVAASIAAATGFAIWAGLSIGGGRMLDGDTFIVGEAWDGPAYWTLGLTAYALAAAVGGYIVPQKVWRWPLFIALGQGAAMILLRPPGSDFALVPVALLFVGVPLVVALTIPAIAGGILARRSWAPDLLR
jgi:hypothetical protein